MDWVPVLGEPPFRDISATKSNWAGSRYIGGSKWVFTHSGTGLGPKTPMVNELDDGRAKIGHDGCPKILERDSTLCIPKMISV